MSASSSRVNWIRPLAQSGGDALFVVVSCFFMSGMAALIYQTAWARRFALVFGTSELAVATVLAAYMGGLALGAWLVERWLQRVNRPVLMYAVLELGVGASALLWVPAILLASEWLLQALFGQQPAPPGGQSGGLLLFYVVSAFIALGMPAALMGATLPLLARHAVRLDSQIGPRVGILYAVNTAGAVVGVLVAAFWLLPKFGLLRTVWSGVAISLLVGVLAMLLTRKVRMSAVPPAETRAKRHARFLREVALEQSVHESFSPVWLLPLVFLCGAVSFFHEVLWTRLLGHVVGSSIYAFGVMVASFLAGIALGGFIGAALARNRRACLIALAVSQLLAAAAAAAAFLLLDRIVPHRTGLAGNALLGVVLLTPLTLCIGVGFPLAVRALADSAREAATASARVYSWSTLGSIAGALAAGFLVIPAMRYEGAIRIAVAASAMLSLAFLALTGRQRGKLLGGAVVAGALVFFVFRPPLPHQLLLSSPLGVSNEGRIIYYDVGRSASVVMLKQDGALALRTNGLPEALIEPSGSPPKFSGERWLSPLAVAARPRTQSMLIVGYGGGGSVEAVPPSVRRIDVIELEPKVIEAARATRSLRKRDPLSDPRLHVIANDARAALNLTDRRYDAIVSQPSHPWTAGASHLYTREFMSQARAHLNGGGVFVQWMNVRFLDEPLLRSLAATVLDVFDEARLYRPDPDTLIFIASDRPLDIENDVASTGLPLRLQAAHFGRIGINTVEDLVAALAADSSGIRAMAAGAPLITDDRNRLATSSVYELGRGLTAEQASKVLAAHDPLTNPDSSIHRALANRLAFGYIARRLAVFAPQDAGIPDRLLRVADVLSPAAGSDVVRAIAHTSAGRSHEAERILQAALARDPHNEAARFEYMRPWLSSFARGVAPEHIVSEASHLSGPAAVILQAEALAARNQWQELSQLDPVLADAQWTDPWKIEAVQLQAGWRTRAPSPAMQSMLGDESLALVDRAIVVQPTLALYGLRAHGALAAGRPDALVESIWSYGQGLYANGLRLPADERAETKANLEVLIELLDAQPMEEAADAARLAEVRAKLEDAARRLEQA